jgi:membrane protein
MKLKDFGVLLKEAANSWLEDKAPRLGAALAYYTVFSLAPLLLVAIFIAGLIFGKGPAQDQIIGQIRELVGEEGGQAVRSILDHATQPSAGLVGSLLSIAMLLFGAVGLFVELQDALNTIWGVQPKAGRGIWGIIRDRILSFTMVLVLAFLLLMSLIVSTLLAASVQFFGEWRVGVIGHVINEGVSLVVIALLFAMIFRFLPDVKIGWGDVWLGAALTAVLFELGKFLIGLYLGHSGVASAYGAAGSLAVLLVWLYYSGQIFLFGAEFTKVYANKYGSRIIPADNAVRITAEERAEQGIPRRGECPTLDANQAAQAS